MGQQLHLLNSRALLLRDGSWGSNYTSDEQLESYFLGMAVGAATTTVEQLGSYFLRVAVGAATTVHLLNSWVQLLKGGSWGSNYICWTVGSYFLGMKVGAAPTSVKQLGPTS